MSIEELMAKIVALEKRVSVLEQRDKEKLLTIAEVAEMLKLSKAVVYSKIKSGIIPAIDYEGVLRIRKQDVLDNMNRIKQYRRREVKHDDIQNA